MLKKYAMYYALIVGLLPAYCFAEDAAQKNLVNFEMYAQQVKQDWRVPGMAIAIVNDGKIFYAKGFGVRNEKNDPVTSDTAFDIASLTKSFTAALMAVQIDQGKYTWNTKILRLYPEFKLYDPIATNEFEVRDLIAHDSGLPPDATDNLGDFGYSTESIIHALRFIKPIAQFRTQFAYEDVFPVLAKEIIQKMSGESYSTNLHRYLLTPLQMHNTYVVTEKQFAKSNNVAWPFVEDGGELYPYAKNYPYISEKWALENGIGSGGIESSANDLAKWLLFNMNNGAIGDRQLISKKNMNFIHSPQAKIQSSNDPNLTDEAAEAYGEGWFIDTQSYKPYTVLYHPGGGTGMHALMAYIPEKKIGIVILTNTWGNKVPEVLYRRWFDLYFNKKPLKDWSKLILRAREKALAEDSKASKSNHCSEKSLDDLNRYVGTYYNPTYGNLIISMKNERLYLVIGPQKITWQLTPCQKNILRAYWPNPGGMSFPMIPDGQDKIQFTERSNNAIQKMTIPFLNDDGSSVFVKK